MGAVDVRTWSDAPPEREGYYWWRAKPGLPKSVVWVRNVSMWRHTESLRAYFHGSATSHVPEVIGGQWGGPLREPGD